MEPGWADSLNMAITACDTTGKIIYMNESSLNLFSKDGGEELLGKNLCDCHPEPARSRLRDLLENPRMNMYTIEKKGIRKMIVQSPWYLKGEFAGLVEISFLISSEIPHFVRE